MCRNCGDYRDCDDRAWSLRTARGGWNSARANSCWSFWSCSRYKPAVDQWWGHWVIAVVKSHKAPAKQWSHQHHFVIMSSQLINSSSFACIQEQELILNRIALIWLQPAALNCLNFANGSVGTVQSSQVYTETDRQMHLGHLWYCILTSYCLVPMLMSCHCSDYCKMYVTLHRLKVFGL